VFTAIVLIGVAGATVELLVLARLRRRLRRILRMQRRRRRRYARWRVGGGVDRVRVGHAG
jgi:hypothetical protein